MKSSVQSCMLLAVSLASLAGCGEGSVPSSNTAPIPLNAASSATTTPTASPLAAAQITAGDPSSRAATGETAPAFRNADVSFAAKIAAGRNPNPDPDGADAKTPASLTQTQISAVDLNLDGSITQADVAQILAMATSGTAATVPSAPALTSVTPGNQQISLSFSTPGFSGGRAVTSYTATCTAGDQSASVSGSASPLLVTGLTNGTAYACTVRSNNAVGQSLLSTALTTTPTSPAATSFAPATFVSGVDTAYTVSTLVKATGFVSRKRYLIGDSAATPTLWQTGAKGTNVYPLEGATIASGSSYRDVLSKTLHAVVDSTDSTCFRLDAHLNSNYSIDVDTSAANRLVFRNNWGITGTTGHGHVCFTYTSATQLLRAGKRYTYDSSTYKHSQDTSFTLGGYYVKFANGVASLVASASEATPVALYGSPINFDMPSDFNPNSLVGSTNSSMPFRTALQKITSTSLSDLVSRRESEAFRAQISADGTHPSIGYNTSTVAQQDTMLATIDATAKANGFTLRYPLSTYKVFRDAALRYTLLGDSIVDGTLGENTVPLIYFINPKDASGAYHPAMIVVAYSVPEAPHYLRDVVRPPGGGVDSITICNQGTSETGYANQCVTRSTVRQNFFFRIPMRDYGLTDALCDNTMTATLYSDFNQQSECGATATVENYASIADNGVLIDGTSIYPVMNNILITSQEESSLNMHGCHVGQGFGYHCHADGFSAVDNGMSLYNRRDYAGKAHPPLIGFGFDGIALYGRYLSAYPGMVGYTASNTSPTSTTTITGMDLDAYGGHIHEIDGVSRYHQHARPYTTQTLPMGSIKGGLSYTVHSLITGAWRGRINAIPNFWDGDKPNTRGVFPLLTQ